MCLPFWTIGRESSILVKEAPAVLRMPFAHHGRFAHCACCTLISPMIQVLMPSAWLAFEGPRRLVRPALSCGSRAGLARGADSEHRRGAGSAADGRGVAAVAVGHRTAGDQRSLSAHCGVSSSLCQQMLKPAHPPRTDFANRTGGHSTHTCARCSIACSSSPAPSTPPSCAPYVLPPAPTVLASCTAPCA